MELYSVSVCHFTVFVVNYYDIAVGEPSLDEIFALLSGDDIDLLKIVQELDKVVDTLIENEQTASYEFSSVSSSGIFKILLYDRDNSWASV